MKHRTNSYRHCAQGSVNEGVEALYFYSERVKRGIRNVTKKDNSKGLNQNENSAVQAFCTQYTPSVQRGKKCKIHRDQEAQRLRNRRTKDASRLTEGAKIGEGKVRKSQDEGGENHACVVEPPTHDEPNGEKGIGQKRQDQKKGVQLLHLPHLFRESWPLPDK